MWWIRGLRLVTNFAMKWLNLDSWVRKARPCAVSGITDQLRPDFFYEDEASSAASL